MSKSQTRRVARVVFFALLAIASSIFAGADPLTLDVYQDLLGPGSSGTKIYPAGIVADSSGNVIATSPWHCIFSIAPDGTKSVIAGSMGTTGSADGPAASARFNRPEGIARDASGALFIADSSNKTVRKLIGGMVTTVAGLAGASGFVDGVGGNARFGAPYGVAVDGDGNVFVTDVPNHAIRRIAPDGTVTTIAGNGTAGAVDGIGSAARFNSPQGIALDASGNLWVADGGNHAIRIVTPSGQVSTLAGTLGVSGRSDGTGGAASFQYPDEVAFDANGELIVGDSGNYALRRVTAAGVVTTVAAGYYEGHVAGTGFFAKMSMAGAITLSGSKVLIADSYYDSYSYPQKSYEVFWTLVNPIADRVTIDQATGMVGDSRQLSSSPQTAVSWNWYLIAKPSNSTASLSSTLRDTTFTPDVAGNFTIGLRAVDASGDVSISSVNLLASCPTVPSPSITRTPTTNPICAGETVTLEASEGYARYLWSTGATTRSIVVSPTATTTYSVKGYDAVGCASSERAATIYVATDPNTAISSTFVTYCSYNSGYEASVPYQYGATYTWTIQGGTITSYKEGTRIVVIDPADSGDVVLNVRVDVACKTGTGTKTIPIDDIGGTITADRPMPICPSVSSTRLTIAPRYKGLDTWLTLQWYKDSIPIQGAIGRSLIDALPGVYKVWVKDHYCQGWSETFTVTAHPWPNTSVNASGPTTFCEGGSVTLTAAAGNAYTYLWTTGETTRAITATVSGNYRVTVTDANGCSAQSAEWTVTTKPLPAIPSIAASGPMTFCAGGSVALSAPVGFTYLWSNGAASREITVSQAGNYSVTITSANGCKSTSMPVAVVVNPLPVATITAGGATTFCEGGSVMLTASAGASYLWSNGATTQSITATESGSYSVTVMNASSCSTTSATTLVTVTPLPAATITPSGATTFCEGGSVVLTASAGSSYLWSNGATTQSITATQSASYSVTVTNASGCSTTSAATPVTANPLPAATITPDGATTFCAGGSVVLTASPGASYLWSNGATSPSITVTQSGTYNVRVTNENACSTTSAGTTVTVNPLPVATVSPNVSMSFCEGGSGLLTASAGASYLWSNGATTRSIAVTQTGNYSVTVTNANGCASTSTGTIVTVHPAQAAEITPNGPTTFCPGGSVVLTASAGASYHWSNGATTQSITVTQTGFFNVTVTSANSCSAISSTMLVSVNPVPTPTITATGPTTFCEGGSVLLTASAGSSYLWSNGATTQAITATQSGSYSVTVTNASGCSSTSSAKVVTVNPLPAPTIAANGPTTFCQGGSVVLTASAGSSYLWSNGATTQAITATQSGNYSVTVTNASGCSSTSSATTVTVNSIPAATITPNRATTFCEGGSVVLTSSVGTSYLWSNGATTQAITATLSGNYSVTVTNASGCSSTSAATAVTVSPIPAATITPNGATTFCQGGSVVLTASAGSSYLWSNGATTQVITVTQSGNYSVAVTNASGCSSTSAATAVTVKALPTAIVSGGGNICAGGSTTVQASLTGTAPWSITWSDGFVQSGIATSVATRSVNPSSTRNYAVTSVSDASCSGSSSGSAVVTVTPLPSAVVSGSATICNGSQATVSAALTGVGPWTLTWSDGFVQSGIAASPATRAVTPSVTTTYSVTAVSGASCGGTASGSATITVNQKPTINTQPVSKTIKKNTTTTLTVAATGTGTLSYQWYRGASGVTTAPVGTNSTSYTTPRLLSTTQYWVKVTNSCGSTNSVTATVTVP